MDATVELMTLTLSLVFWGRLFSILLLRNLRNLLYLIQSNHMIVIEIYYSLEILLLQKNIRNKKQYIQNNPVVAVE